MYATPVVYVIPKSGILKTIMEINPLTALVSTIRATLTGQEYEFLSYFIVLGSISFVLFFVGLVIYRVSIPVIVERLKRIGMADRGIGKSRGACPKNSVRI